MKPKIDYDTQWKAVIEEYFEEFVGFFLPALYTLNQIIEALGCVGRIKSTTWHHAVRNTPDSSG